MIIFSVYLFITIIAAILICIEVFINEECYKVPLEVPNEVAAILVVSLLWPLLIVVGFFEFITNRGKT